MKRLIIVPALALLLLFALWGCENDTSNGPVDPDDGPAGTDKTCLGCHSSEEMLKASLPDTSGSKVLIGNKGDG
jgi:hypothetical protein